MSNKSNEWYIERLEDSKLAKKSLSLYKCLINKILRGSGEKDLHEILMNPEKYVKSMTGDEIPLNTQDAMLGTILSVLSYSGLKESNTELYNLWYKEFRKVNERKQEIARSNIPSDKQKKGLLVWNEVLKKRDELGKKEYGSMRHLLLSMYSCIPPRRQLDYANMRVYFDPEIDVNMDHNQFHVYNKKMGSGYMLIHEYKTKKSYNNYLDKELPIELIKVVISSFKQMPRRKMFVTEKGKDFTNANHFQNYSNNMLKEIFENNNVTVNSLRHSFASCLRSLRDLSVYDHDRLSKKMGHSLSKNLEYAFFESTPHQSHSH